MDIFDKKGIKPMLISERTEPYDDEDSIFEFKVDGVRGLSYNDKHSSDFRNKRDIKIVQRFPELQTVFKNCKQKCILDGEINVLVDGRPNYYEVQRRSTLTNPFKIELAHKKYPANFVAFDIIYYKNRSVIELPLMERKELLRDVVSECQAITISRYIETNGIALFNLAEKYGLEGVVGKKKASQYWFGKETKEWKKIKVVKDDDYVCIGFFPPNDSHMSTLILAKYDSSNELKILSHVSLGVSLSKILRSGIKTSNCPVNISDGYSGAIWVEPFVCTIEYMPSDKSGLRQATFKGLRDDKSPEECRIK